MIALIDIGNTNIVLARYNGDFTDNYRFTTDKHKSMDEYYVILKDALAGVNEIIISSVVPELNSVMRLLSEKYLSIIPLFIGPGVKTGVKIHADNPKEVGADLVAASAGVIEHYGSDAIIVDMGTATTFTYLHNGSIKGVSITTGLLTQRSALISGASQLTQFEFKAPKHVLGTNTVDCLNAGLLYGHAFMIEGIVKAIRAEHKTNAPLILTGGAGRFIKDLLAEEVIYDELLLMKGLLAIRNRNR
jgi:type III pantothenate kinase